MLSLSSQRLGHRTPSSAARPVTALHPGRRGGLGAILTPLLQRDYFHLSERSAKLGTLF
jgi:hypothetical protein